MLLASPLKRTNPPHSTKPTKIASIANRRTRARPSDAHPISRGRVIRRNEGYGGDGKALTQVCRGKRETQVRGRSAVRRQSECDHLQVKEVTGSGGYPARYTRTRSYITDANYRSRFSGADRLADGAEMEI
ncbi:hypothetical protein Trydic_g21874 [Trypoxylus dichotomus]